MWLKLKIWWLKQQERHFQLSAEVENAKAKQAHADARHYLQRLRETQIRRQQLKNGTINLRS